MAWAIRTTNSESCNKQLRNNSKLKASFPQVQQHGSEEIRSLVAQLGIWLIPDPPHIYTEEELDTQAIKVKTGNQ